MKPKHKRILILSALLLVICLVASFVLWVFSDNLAFYYTPTQILTADRGKRVKLGGTIADIKKNDMVVNFDVTDFVTTVKVEYFGVLPPLFKEGGGVVATGKITDEGIFLADELLNRHNEYYMPSFVAAQKD
jgi:cytochrome c-type biogenesis protein CcmE